MPKLRKMLGSVQHSAVIALMRLIETQSLDTLARWALDQAEARYLTLCPAEAALTRAVCAARACLSGAAKSTLAAPLKAATALVRSLTDPVAQASARAVVTACGVFRTPTNALGYVFYGAAAFAYSQAGLEASPAVYDALADQELQRLLSSLEAIAVADEEHPVKIDWNC